EGQGRPEPPDAVAATRRAPPGPARSELTFPSPEGRSSSRMARMIIVERKSVFKRLNTTCVNALNQAAGQCMNARQYEITVEHVMLSLLDNADSDIAFLAMHYDLDPARFRKALHQGLEELRTGNAGKPTFSPKTLDWIQDAWTIASLDYDFQKIR